VSVEVITPMSVSIRLWSRRPAGMVESRLVQRAVRSLQLIRVAAADKNVMNDYLVTRPLNRNHD
jgi:ABC-type uncharacterized transport system auxiliary subunit